MYFRVGDFWTDGIQSHQMYSSDGDHSILKILYKQKNSTYGSLFLALVANMWKYITGGFRNGDVTKRITLEIWSLSSWNKIIIWQKLCKQHFVMQPFQNPLLCIAAPFNVQTPERRHGNTRVLTCMAHDLTVDRWLRTVNIFHQLCLTIYSQLSSSCQGRRCGTPFAASITVQITPHAPNTAKLGRTPLRFSPLSFRLCVAHAQLIPW